MPIHQDTAELCKAGCTFSLCKSTILAAGSFNNLLSCFCKSSMPCSALEFSFCDCSITITKNELHCHMQQRKKQEWAHVISGYRDRTLVFCIRSYKVAVILCGVKEIPVLHVANLTKYNLQLISVTLKEKVVPRTTLDIRPLIQYLIDIQ